jgi:hypothetical protein
VLPAFFQRRRALAVLNTAAVGLALASMAGGVLCPALTALGTTYGRRAVLQILHWQPSVLALFVPPPTLIAGTLWAWLLRSPKTVGQRSLRRGWAASVPLAMLAGSLAAVLASTSLVPLEGSFHAGAALAGAIASIPVLAATLLCLGVPLAWAQRLASKGLAAGERGERIVGLTCVVLSLVGLVASLRLHAPIDWRVTLSLGPASTRALAVLGALAGGASVGLALSREARRRRFVREAEAGKIAGYRVDGEREGKVLVRVVSQGAGYRVADDEEEVFELDSDGEATRPKRAMVAQGL